MANTPSIIYFDKAFLETLKKNTSYGTTLPNPVGTKVGTVGHKFTTKVTMTGSLAMWIGKVSNDNVQMWNIEHHAVLICKLCSKREWLDKVLGWSQPYERDQIEAFCKSHCHEAEPKVEPTVASKVETKTGRLFRED